MILCSSHKLQLQVHSSKCVANLVWWTDLGLTSGSKLSKYNQETHDPEIYTREGYNMEIYTREAIIWRYPLCE